MVDYNKLREAAEHFVAKVDSGKMYSVEDYGYELFKEALNAPDDNTCGYEYATLYAKVAGVRDRLLHNRAEYPNSDLVTFSIWVYIDDLAELLTSALAPSPAPQDASAKPQWECNNCHHSACEADRLRICKGCGNAFVDTPPPVIDPAKVRAVVNELGQHIQKYNTHDLIIPFPVMTCFLTLTALLDAAPAPAPQDAGYGPLQHAQVLAQSIAEKHYPECIGHWEIGNDVMFVLDQISNLVSGMARTPPPVGIDRDALQRLWSDLETLRENGDYCDPIPQADIEAVQDSVKVLLDGTAPAPQEPMMPVRVVEEFKADFDNKYHNIKIGTYADKLKTLAMWAWDKFDSILAPYRPAPQEPMMPVRVVDEGISYFWTHGLTYHALKIHFDGILAPYRPDCTAPEPEPTTPQRAWWWLHKQPKHDKPMMAIMSDLFYFAAALAGDYDTEVRAMLKRDAQAAKDGDD